MTTSAGDVEVTNHRLKEAMEHAAWMRTTLPQINAPTATARDLVVLADEIDALACRTDQPDAAPCFHDFDNGGTCKLCGWPFERAADPTLALKARLAEAEREAERLKAAQAGLGPPGAADSADEVQK